MNRMTEFQTGAVRDTGGKGRMDLLPWCALLRVSRHMENAILPDPETGQPHYPERNWEKGMPVHNMLDSAFRHLAKYMEGWIDEDHLCAAASNLLMAMWMEENHPEMVDIPSRAMLDVQPSNIDSTVNPLKEKGSVDLPKSICPCYNSKNSRCNGTRECEPCNCMGDRDKCDFYGKKS